MMQSKQTVLPLIHFTSPSVTDSANGGVDTTFTSSPAQATTTPDKMKAKLNTQKTEPHLVLPEQVKNNTLSIITQITFLCLKTISINHCCHGSSTTSH